MDKTDKEHVIEDCEKAAGMYFTDEIITILKKLTISDLIKLKHVFQEVYDEGLADGKDPT